MQFNRIIYCFFLFIGTLYSQNISKVTIQNIDTILSKKMSVRAILPDTDKLWFAANKNVFGYYDLKSKKVFEKKIEFNNKEMEFRSIAQTKKYVFVASIGSPAYIFRINKKTLEYTMVFEDNHKDAFLDSMTFADNKFGIVVGDPTSDCMTILFTKNGGKNWKKIPCDLLPRVEKGEAAFAASNSNVITNNGKIWIISGGVKSRIFFSENGNDFIVNDLPIVQGQSMTGAFTADFYDDKIGIVAGGDYEKPLSNMENKAITTDGGKHWETIADGIGFGYASCIQYVPHSLGKRIVSVGATGLFYSIDGGNSWEKLLDDTTFYTIRFLDENTLFAAGKDKIVQYRLSW